jgi:hypothetical protein
MIGDDMVFETQGWDKEILSEINKRKGHAIVHCNDMYLGNGKCCINLFTTREMVKKQERPFMCPHFQADMIDMVWYFAGVMTGTIAYREDIIIRHEHESSKEQFLQDETYRRLQPIQQVINGNKENMKLAKAWATMCAASLIENGVGSWKM